jgi:hypothetical protein
MMHQFIGFMLDNKLISEGELDSNGLEETFNKYYFSKTTINYIELAGLQYFNMGIYNLPYYRLNDAIRNFEKSVYFYDSERTRSLLFITYRQYLLTSFYYADTGEVNHFLKYYYVTPQKYREEAAIDEFKHMDYEILISRGDQKMFDYFYDRIRTSITDDTLVLRRIKLIYNYEKGRVAIMNNDFNTGLKYINAASFLEPKNIEYRQSAEFAITKQLCYINHPVKRIERLDEITRVYKHMKEFGTVKMMYALNYLESAKLSLSQNNINEANLHLEKFEKTREFKGIDTSNIASVYCELSKQYEKQNNLTASKRSIERGLSVLPTNSLLANQKQRLYQLK